MKKTVSLMTIMLHLSNLLITSSIYACIKHIVRAPSYEDSNDNLSVYDLKGAIMLKIQMELKNAKTLVSTGYRGIEVVVTEKR